MKRYPIRVVKYVVYLAILFFVIFTFMNAVGGTNVPIDTLFTTTRGMWLLLVVVLFALLYPFFGFTKKTITIDASLKGEELQNVMNMCGYMRTAGTDQAMEFRANGGFKRLMLMYEDRITVTTVDGLSTMSGPRKEVVKAAFRAGTFIQ